MTLRFIDLGAAPIALVVLLTFGCTTVRAPASSIGTDVTFGGNGAGQQVELWLESATPITPEEKAQAVAQVRAALDHAASTLVSQDEEALLVVRAQGIARTGSRKANQNAAKVGIVVGAAALIAVVVVAVVASGGKGGGSASKGGGGFKAAGPVRAAPSIAPRVSPPRFAFPVPVAGGHHDHAAVVGVGVHVDAPVVVGTSEPAIGQPVAVGPVEGPVPREERTAYPPAEPVKLNLPPPPPFGVTHRKFFDKDFTRLQLLVVDRGTGRATWVKTVEGNTDPRDARAVKALVAKAIQERDGWERVTD